MKNEKYQGNIVDITSYKKRLFFPLSISVTIIDA